MNVLVEPANAVFTLTFLQNQHPEEHFSVFLLFYL